MNNFYQEASEAGEIPYEGKSSKHWRKTWLTDEGLTTPGTAFTSPWMDTNKYPDTCFVNTATQTANKYPNSTFISALTPMSPTDKVDSWFTSTPAGPSQSSTSRPNTRDTALTSIAGDQSQLLDRSTGSAFIDPTATGPTTQDLFQDSFVGDQSQLPTTQMEGSNSSINANQSKPSTPRLSMTDPFFDSVPKGPSQLSTSRWNARATAFSPWHSTRDQTPASPWNKTGTSFSPGKHL